VTNVAPKRPRGPDQFMVEVVQAENPGKRPPGGGAGCGRAAVRGRLRQCPGSGHRNGVSRDIGIGMSRVFSMARRLTLSAESMLGGVETSSCHHRRPCRSIPVRGRPYLRGLSGLDQPPHGPLPRRGRSRLRTTLARPEDQPRRHRTGHGRPRPTTTQTARRVRPGRRRGHHRLAPDPPPRRDPVARDDQPDPGPPRHRDPRPVQTAQVVLHPVRSRAAQRDLAVRLHPLPAHLPRRHSRRGHRDHHLARRPLPLRPAHLSPRPHHRSDRAGHLPHHR
jgi:hypothetical protein